jgi:hypothetical protein
MKQLLFFSFILSISFHVKATEILQFQEIEKIIFPPQVRVEVAEFDIEEIHSSIRLHFTDKKPNEEQFDDEERGFTPKMLENLLNYYGSGDYTIGLAPQNWSSRQLVFPINEIEGCKVGARVPKLSEDQQNQMVDQLVSFWKEAEKGTDEKKSEFMRIRSFSYRIQAIMVANDLFLCSFINSLKAPNLPWRP